ncbi:Phosphoenolpyruvate phosphomutase (fragment) [Acidithiobacillus ferrivorans]|uniref:Phosphoenolpyruvate phosphomutase n=1 Tax=Acidithiobacillus ferrivorans TaxID=160808 RepID=A0A060UVB7_9PROT
MTLLVDRMRSGESLLVAGAYDGISAHLVESNGFDAIWVSGFCISSSKFVPDENVLTSSELVERTTEIIEASDLPVIVDCDEGYGSLASTLRLVRKLSSLGVGGICLEDNLFPKINSFNDREGSDILLAPVAQHAAKLSTIKKAFPNIALIARTEEFIRGGTLASARQRLEAYCDAGADVVILHSRFEKINNFMEIRNEWKHAVPLAVIPTKCSDAGYLSFQRLGFSMIIYANQPFRAAVNAMVGALSTIRQGSTSSICGLTPMEYFFSMFDSDRETTNHRSAV